MSNRFIFVIILRVLEGFEDDKFIAWPDDQDERNYCDLVAVGALMTSHSMQIFNFIGFAANLRRQSVNAISFRALLMLQFLICFNVFNYHSEKLLWLVSTRIDFTLANRANTRSVFTCLPQDSAFFLSTSCATLQTKLKFNLPEKKKKKINLHQQWREGSETIAQ